ncbi:MAG: hypothetical protein AVDCRST_MAG57-3774, partial [uncultured Blastococcus sp.]
ADDGMPPRRKPLRGADRPPSSAALSHPPAPRGQAVDDEQVERHRGGWL